MPGPGVDPAPVTIATLPSTRPGRSAIRLSSLVDQRQAVSSALQRASDWQIAHLVITPFGIGASGQAGPDSATTIDSLSGQVPAPRTR